MSLYPSIEHYDFIKKIGQGNHGFVTLCKHKVHGTLVAIKHENESSTSSTSLDNEASVYQKLFKDINIIPKGIPKFICYSSSSSDGSVNNNKKLVISCLGASLSTWLENKYKSEPVPGQLVAYIGMELLDVLEFIHSRGFVHRDIKPTNIMFDFPILNSKEENNNNRNESKSIYLVDYGFTCDFKNEKLEYLNKTSLEFTGNPRYCSINTHLCLPPSPRDDLESVGYLMLEMLIRKLPWSGLILNDGNHQQKQHDRSFIIKEVKRVKTNTTIDDLCKDIELSYPEIKKFIIYTRSLRISDNTPNYDYLRTLLKSVIQREEEKIKILNSDWASLPLDAYPIYKIKNNLNHILFHNSDQQDDDEEEEEENNSRNCKIPNAYQDEYEIEPDLESVEEWIEAPLVYTRLVS
jgi:casein kinase 1